MKPHDDAFHRPYNADNSRTCAYNNERVHLNRGCTKRRCSIQRLDGILEIQIKCPIIVVLKINSRKTSVRKHVRINFIEIVILFFYDEFKRK